MVHSCVCRSPLLELYTVNGILSQKNPLHVLILFLRVAQIFEKSGSHLKILGTRRVTQSKFHTVDLHVLVAMATRRPAFVHLCLIYFKSCLNIILPSTPWFSKWFLPFTSSESNVVYIFVRWVCAASSHHPIVSNYITWWCLVKSQICESPC